MGSYFWKENKKMSHISYSQLSMFGECPKHWQLNYIDKVGVFEPSIYLVFGSAMHTTLQTYLDTMYKDTIKNADALDMNKLLQENLSEEFLKSKEQCKKNPCTKNQLNEFFQDGVNIINFFKKNRNKYFSKKWELLGCEFPLNVEIKGKLRYVGFIDVILRNMQSGMIKIIDIKTSTRGWRDKEKKDKNKTSQVLLYKYFYSQKYNVPIDNIDVEYFIVKRKLWEKSDFPQKRVQLFSPASGNVSMNRTMKSFNKFISEAFDDEGKKLIKDYEATPSKNSCRWCEFNQTKYCDKGIR
tara:strand:- start:1049 stop:1939 length:891 start_codon:yes stop_codon:yes gene_type:complete